LVECQPVLVFILGYGGKYRFAVAICGEGSAENAPRVTWEKFNSAIRTGVDLSLLISWCYPDGWVLKPMVASSLFPVESLNISGTTPSSLRNSAHFRTIRHPESTTNER
jgi:hypothetical protein